MSVAGRLLWSKTAASLPCVATRHIWPNRDVVEEILLLAFKRLEMRPSIIYLYTEWRGWRMSFGMAFHLLVCLRLYYTCETATLNFRWQQVSLRRCHLYFGTHLYTLCNRISPQSDEKPEKVPATPLRVSEL